VTVLPVEVLVVTMRPVGVAFGVGCAAGVGFTGVGFATGGVAGLATVLVGVGLGIGFAATVGLGLGVGLAATVLAGVGFGVGLAATVGFGVGVGLGLGAAMAAAPDRRAVLRASRVRLFMIKLLSKPSPHLLSISHTPLAIP
jgi:hypothetical protein